MNIEINEDLLSSGRLAWNELDEIFHEEHIPYSTNKTFEPFFKNMIDKLFEESTEA